MPRYNFATTLQQQARRYNAAARRAENIAAAPPSALLNITTISEAERRAVASEADLATDLNRQIENWLKATTEQLKAAAAPHGQRLAQGITPTAYTDKNGLINRIGFSFPRHGIYIHKGAGRGQGGATGSSWTKLRRINGKEISTGIIRHTNPQSLNDTQGRPPRRADQWFDRVMQSALPKLQQIITDHFDTVTLNTANILLNR